MDMSERLARTSEVDRLIERAAATRWTGAGKVGAFDGDYQAGSRYSGRLQGYNPMARGPNEQTQMEMTDMRARSRDMIRNDPIAAGAINVNVGHVVGTGLTMNSTIKAKALGLTEERARDWMEAVNRRFWLYAGSPNVDAAGRNDLYSITSLALRAVLSSGDVAFNLPSIRRQNWPFRLAIELIEADRISNKDNKQDTDTCVAGVELGPNGEETAFWVADRHPYSGMGPAKWERVAARGERSGRLRMGLLFDQARPGEVRGKPYLAPVMTKLKDLSRYSEAELSAAVTAAALTVFTRMDPAAFASLFTNPQERQKYINRSYEWDGTIKPNTTINLLPGEEIDISDSKRPNANFDPFFLSMVRQIGVGLEVPFEVLIQHFDSSYSAARAAMLTAYKTFYRRREWLSKRFLQPIYFEWLKSEVIAGTIEAPGFLNDPIRALEWSQATWIGDGPISLNPRDEAEAAKLRIEAGISTIARESILHDGGNWEEKHAQRTLEVERRREDGLEQDPVKMAEMAAAAKVPPAGGPAPAGDAKPKPKPKPV